MSIKVENLSKEYGEVSALNGVSFDIPKQQIVGFLGPNGAGKSTLMKILTTYLLPTSGTAVVNGFAIDTEQQHVQKSIGYLPEHNPLYLDQYPKEYLAFNAALYKINKQRINEVIELTGLQNELKKKIGNLSKGYRQRVGLACALLHDPQVLLLDEPTTGLDPNQLEDIRKLIKNLGKDKTVLLSTHVMQEVEAMCDRVLVINKGELVADKMLGATNEKQLIVGFDSAISSAQLLQLKQLPQISVVKSVTDTQFVINHIGGSDFAASVFEFAVTNQLRLLQLEEKQLNIEDLFKSVTV